MNRFTDGLPAFMKNAALSALAGRKKRVKYGRTFREVLEFLLSSTAAERAARADEELERFLEGVGKNGRYYEIPADGNVARMPVIDKAAVLSHYREIVAGAGIVVRSSGTTGQPLAVPQSSAAYQKEYAFWWYHRSYGGVRRGDRVATIAGHKVAAASRRKPPFWALNRAENQLVFSSYHLAPATMGAYVRRLNRFKPVFIHGYPSSLYLLARHILENGLSLEFRPKMTATASETTLDFQRQAIEAAFGCKNYIWYGNTELCGHITECSLGRLHVQPYHSLVRVLNAQGREAAPGEEGRIVGTGFSNAAFPLINYDTRDVVRVSLDQHCSCGRGGLLVDHILGRIEDYILTPEGRWIGRLDHLFKNAEHVRNAQIEQRRLGEVIVRIEKDEGYDGAAERAIRNEARARLGAGTQIAFEYVREIPRHPNGKFPFILQRLEGGRTGGIRPPAGEIEAGPRSAP